MTLLGKSALCRGRFSRAGAKTQSVAAFPEVFFAPFRLCVRNIFLLRAPSTILLEQNIWKLKILVSLVTEWSYDREKVRGGVQRLHRVVYG